MMEPVSSLIRKEKDFTWGTEQEEAFQEIKKRFIEEPVLAFHDPEEEAIIETDASDKALGACLSQKKRMESYILSPTIPGSFRQQS
jgi:hypothetical protein